MEDENGVKRKATPSHTHEELVRDSTLFWDSLHNFHSSMGTKLTRIPVIGGKDLDLHILYIEVTKRGGYEKVVAEKKWREVGLVFEFSATTTSASYALKKHYHANLLDFENMYFNKLQSPKTERITFEAIGTIEAKIDCGYLVSVKLGNETLNGVLYHPDQARSSKTINRAFCTDIVPHTPITETPAGQRRRKRKTRRGGDPTHPKPNRSGYNFFFAEKHMELKSLYPNREREFTKMIGESWNNLSLEEKTVYQNYGLQDKERYQKEMQEYKERMKMKMKMKMECQALDGDRRYSCSR